MGFDYTSWVGSVAVHLIHGIIDLVYPPLCLHCSEYKQEREAVFCSDCLALLELIDPMERCPQCFHDNYDSEEHYCGSCAYYPSPIYRAGAVFDYGGPAATLVRKLKYEGRLDLARGAGAFLAAQLIRLDWPLPDLIVPVPISTFRWIERGYNQSDLLAQSLSKIIMRPVVQVLKRPSGGYRQASLQMEQRQQLALDSFVLLENNKLCNKTILLVDDVMTSGSTLRCCGEALCKGNPLRIYSMAFCRS